MIAGGTTCRTTASFPGELLRLQVGFGAATRIGALGAEVIVLAVFLI
jgi:hypothetical protein